jgi:hypothetical protein
MAKLKLVIVGGKCGCPFCRDGVSGPLARTQWKGKKNKRGHSYGVHVKGGRTPRRGSLHT